jgi:hypothetical protein
MGNVASSEHNKVLARQIVEEMFNRGTLDIASEIFAADFVDRGMDRSLAKRMAPKFSLNS